MQNSQKHLTIVIFGATGDLYKSKLAKALYMLFLEGRLRRDFKDFNIIAFARRDLSQKDFHIFTKESILSRGDVDISQLDNFLEHITYFKGDFSNENDFIGLKNIISAGKDGLVVFHLATASILYEKIFENIKNAGLHTLAFGARIMIEKPFGKDELDAKRLQDCLTGIFKQEDIFHIDHYLAKETARDIFDYKLGEKQVEKIKVVFHESNIIGSRGASYDAVGAFRDVGQNHMLQLLALAIMDKPGTLDAKNIRASRLNALNNLYIDYGENITRAQYEGYLSETGKKDADSQTETFFRVFLKSKNSNFSDVVFELEGGKGLTDMHSDITTTTVAVEIYFRKGKNLPKKELKIQPVPGTVYESYTRVYSDTFYGDQTNFPSIEEIIAEWKITDELLEKWQKIPLLIYKKGSKGEDIQ